MEVLKKGNAYSKFKANKVPNVPYCSNLEDIGNNMYYLTQTDHFVNKEWIYLDPNFVYDLTLYCYYHLILDDIGQPLDSFKCS
jgi:hypothetical protein